MATSTFGARVKSRLSDHDLVPVRDRPCAKSTWAGLTRFVHLLPHLACTLRLAFLCEDECAELSIAALVTLHVSLRLGCCVYAPVALLHVHISLEFIFAGQVGLFPGSPHVCCPVKHQKMGVADYDTYEDLFGQVRSMAVLAPVACALLSSISQRKHLSYLLGHSFADVTCFHWLACLLSHQ